MHVASPDEWRNWASLPGDVLCIILSKFPQTDILSGAGLACSPWRRRAKDEPLLWRHIDLRPDPWDEEHEEYCSWDELPLPAGWKAMARAALERSAGRAPLLRNLCVTGWPYIDDGKLITETIKKLPLLERLVMSDGCFQIQLLNALLDHCHALSCWMSLNVGPRSGTGKSLLTREYRTAPSKTYVCRTRFWSDALPPETQ
uniref:Uncharacterized protein n=1 Tax=Aegilops tauschii TaxID=37682 RepID=M8B144_AEGTA